MKVASGHCEALDPELMRTIPEEESRDNQMEMSSEVLRGSEGKHLTSGGKTPAPGPGTAIGECEVWSQDSKEELPALCPNKESPQEPLALIPSRMTGTVNTTLLRTLAKNMPGNAFVVDPGTPFLRCSKIG